MTSIFANLAPIVVAVAVPSGIGAQSLSRCINALIAAGEVSKAEVGHRAVRFNSSQISSVLRLKAG
jgi:hypothetical protein